MSKTARLAILLAAAGASPAAALHKVATYTGVVASGTDVAGLFGAAGRDLTGLAFTSVYTYDTKVGGRSHAPGIDQLYGGSAEGGYYANPFSAATLTIGGVTQALPRTFWAFADAGPGLAEHEVAGDDSYNDHTYTYLYVPGLSSLNVNVPMTTGTGGGMFLFGSGGTKGDVTHVDPNEVIAARGTFDTRTLTISGSVPEPASWALMIAGFGVVGAMARARRRGLAH